METKTLSASKGGHITQDSTQLLKIDGEDITDPMNIKNTILEFYQQLYVGTGDWRPDLVLQENSYISKKNKLGWKDDLRRKNSLKGSNCVLQTKRLVQMGSQWFSIELSGTWDMQKEDVSLTLQNFHDQNFFEKSSNATFVASISKKVGALS